MAKKGSGLGAKSPGNEDRGDLGKKKKAVNDSAKPPVVPGSREGTSKAGFNLKWPARRGLPLAVRAQEGKSSPGTNAAPRRGVLPSPVNLVRHITPRWPRGIAREGVQAGEQSNAAEALNVKRDSPLGPAAIRKIVRIDKDPRLQAPGVQQLLPPYYTTVYEITLLNDDELNRAVAEKIIHPDMSRAQLRNWRRKSRVEMPNVAATPKEAVSGGRQ